MPRNKLPTAAAFAADESDETVMTAPKKASKVAPKEVPERRVKIMLEENENIPPTGQFISVNGRTFMLKPGEPADVPECVINVLNDAVQASPQLDPSTKQVIGYREKLRFPYRIMEGARA